MLDISTVTDSFGYLMEGVLITLELVGASLLLGFVLGILLMLGQVYGPKLLRGFVAVYVWFFRGLPTLILLFLFYFVFIPSMQAFLVAIVVLGMRSAAYQSQIFRGVVENLSEGQSLAARSLGMSKWQTVRYIIVPQTLRLALPSWANEYPSLLTDSAVVSAIGVAELLTRTGYRVAATGNALVLYLACAAMFILLNYGGMLLIQKIEERVRIPGFGNNESDMI